MALVSIVQAPVLGMKIGVEDYRLNHADGTAVNGSLIGGTSTSY